MPDEFDQELDRGPEGSIITPIFLGCGAMGLGCVFSVGAIAIAVMIFLPGIWTLVNQFNDAPMVAETLPLVEASEQVVAAVGLPMEAEFNDLNNVDDGEINYQIGDAINFVSYYDVRGPLGSARVEAQGSRAVVSDEEWMITSVVVTLSDGTRVRVFPPETETQPVTLAPPDGAPPMDEGGDKTNGKPAED